MADLFHVRITVRGYELDTQGHLNQAIYLQYAEHARWECLRAAGVAQDKLLADGIGPVVLETTISFRKELRGGDEVDVTCEFEWGAGKTFQLRQQIVTTDGKVAADVVAVGGFLDLEARRLIPDPTERLRALSSTPELLGL